MNHVCVCVNGGQQSKCVGYVLMTVLTNGVYPVAGGFIYYGATVGELLIGQG